jgi:hypothetical protein
LVYGGVGMNFYVDEFMGIKQSPKEMPYIRLVTDDWDDSSTAETLFHAFYKGIGEHEIDLGDIKIQTTKGVITRNHIPRYFTELDETFCSLGQTISEIIVPGTALKNLFLEEFLICSYVLYLVLIYR